MSIYQSQMESGQERGTAQHDAGEVLADRITSFLAKYGKRSAMEPGEWASPDACELESVAMYLVAGKKPARYPWSEWGSGGYDPYTSREGRTEHDELLRIIGERIN